MWGRRRASEVAGSQTHRSALLGGAGVERESASVGECARAGSGTLGLSFDASGMSLMRRLNGSASGSASVTVQGSSLGLAGYTVQRIGDDRRDGFRADELGVGLVGALPAWPGNDGQQTAFDVNRYIYQLSGCMQNMKYMQKTCKKYAQNVKNIQKIL